MVAIADEDLQPYVKDLRVILEFVTAKLCDLELGRQKADVTTPLSEIAKRCRLPAAAHSVPPMPMDIIPTTCLDEKSDDLEVVDLESNAGGELPHPFVPEKIGGLEFSPPPAPQVNTLTVRRSGVHHHNLHHQRSTRVGEWVPMTGASLERASCCAQIRFVWIGLVHNLKLKHVYIKLRQELQVYHNQSATMSWFSHRKMKDNMVDNHQQQLVADGESADADEAESAITVAQNYLASLEDLLNHEWPEVGYKTSTLFHLASCPIDVFIDEYTKVRDDAMSNENIEERRRQLVKTFASGVAGLDTLVGDLKVTIDNNDQIAFKAFLLFVNLCTCVGQYIFNHFIHPNRTYKCKLPE